VDMFSLRRDDEWWFSETNWLDWLDCHCQHGLFTALTAHSTVLAETRYLSHIIS